MCLDARVFYLDVLDLCHINEGLCELAALIKECSIRKAGVDGFSTLKEGLPNRICAGSREELCRTEMRSLIVVENAGCDTLAAKLAVTSYLVGTSSELGRGPINDIPRRRVLLTRPCRYDQSSGGVAA